MFQKFLSDFHQNIIEESRWEYFTRGILITLEVAFFAVILGVLLGCIVSIIRSSYDLNINRHKMSVINVIMWPLNFICKVYITIIRGTPAIVQLMIIYYVIFSGVDINKVFVAILAFGINSGAYVSEIMRSGIMAVDKGQFEASRSLGMNYVQTMIYIILPQAVKNVLPALGNEFITLLKETSISGAIALNELTRGASIIGSQTYNYLFSLLFVAIIYLALVMILQYFISKLERRLRVGDR